MATSLGKKKLEFKLECNRELRLVANSQATAHVNTRPQVVWPIFGDQFISQNAGEVCVSFTLTDSRLCILHVFEWLNFNFLHNSQWITFPTHLCPVLFSLAANLLKLLTI